MKKIALSSLSTLALCVIPSIAYAQSLSQAPGHPFPKIVTAFVSTPVYLIYRDPKGRPPVKTGFGDDIAPGIVPGTVIGTDYKGGVIIKWDIMLAVPNFAFGCERLGYFFVQNADKYIQYYPNPDSQDTQWHFSVEQAIKGKAVLPTVQNLIGQWEGGGRYLQVTSGSECSFGQNAAAPGCTYSISGDTLTITVKGAGTVYTLDHVRVRPGQEILTLDEQFSDRPITLYSDLRDNRQSIKL